MTEDEWIKNELLKKYTNKSSKKDRKGKFATFQGFYQWAMENGYESGDTISRHDTSKPISPENCYITKSKGCAPLHGPEREDFIRRWTETVNRIRRAWGLPLLELPQEKQQ